MGSIVSHEDMWSVADLIDSLPVVGRGYRLWQKLAGTAFSASYRAWIRARRQISAWRYGSARTETAIIGGGGPGEIVADKSKEKEVRASLDTFQTSAVHAAYHPLDAVLPTSSTSHTSPSASISHTPSSIPFSLGEPPPSPLPTEEEEKNKADQLLSTSAQQQLQQPPPSEQKLQQHISPPPQPAPSSQKKKKQQQRQEHKKTFRDVAAAH